MEPAAEGREHDDPKLVTRARKKPQWSPPLKGGSTST